jgi:hypothetical protein
MILDEVRKTIETCGEQATIALLRNARQEISPHNDIKFVITCVCNILQVSIDRLVHGTSNDESTKYAKGFIVYYLRNDFQVGWKEIKTLLNHRNQSWLWELMKLIKTLKPRFAADIPWILLKQRLDTMLKDYKTKKTYDHGEK